MGAVTVVLLVLLALVACKPSIPSAGSDTYRPTAVESAPPGIEGQTPEGGATLAGDAGCQPQTTGYPANRADGNHFVAGTARLPGWERLEVPLGQEGLWVAGVTSGGGSLWAIGLADGSVLAVHAVAGRLEREILSETGPIGAPVAIRATETGASLLRESLPNTSPATHPLLLPDGSIAGPYADGPLHYAGPGGEASLAVDALPDARPLLDRAGRVVIATGPTDQYRHGVLGDAIEASGITLIEAGWPPRVASEVRPPAGTVFEMIAPLVADVDGDGEDEIVATASDAGQGARYLLYNGEGERLGQSEPIGRGNRWRHAIAVAPFALDGSMELVGVLTPHLGRVVEFHRWQQDRWEPTASLAGYSSHQLGSRNLDQAVAGDFDADGQIELLVPDPSLTTLAAIERGPGGTVREEWVLGLGAKLSSNLAATCHGGQGLGLAAAVEGGQLRLWLPPEAGSSSGGDQE